MSLHEILHTLSEECIGKVAFGDFTSSEYAAFLHEARRFQHFVDALKMRTNRFSDRSGRINWIPYAKQYGSPS